MHFEDQLNPVNIYCFHLTIQQICLYNFKQLNHDSDLRCWTVKGPSSVNGKETMRALNPLYQRNMGQLTGLSFENIKTINMAYCADSCMSTSLARPCQHGGYQDPNNCGRCICPDGFEGQYCDALAKPTNGEFCLRSDNFTWLVPVSINLKRRLYSVCIFFLIFEINLVSICLLDCCYTVYYPNNVSD